MTSLTATHAAAPTNLRLIGDDVSAMIDGWLAKHGARRFERGFCTEYFSLKTYLTKHGVTFTMNGNDCFLSRGPGRPNKVGWTKVWQLVDEFRRADGLEPILRGVK